MCVDCNGGGKTEPWHEGETCQQAKARRSIGLNDNLMETERLTRLTTKKCPSCDFPVSHWHGHACHHIAPLPGNGCPNCGTHWCYGCETTGDNAGHCGSVPECSVFCRDDDILEHIDSSSGWPVDDRCGCQMCPDCRHGVPCVLCRGDCVVCRGTVPPGSMAIHVPETVETDPAILLKRLNEARDREQTLTSDLEASQRALLAARNRACPEAGGINKKHVMWFSFLVLLIGLHFVPLPSWWDRPFLVF